MGWIVMTLGLLLLFWLSFKARRPQAKASKIIGLKEWERLLLRLSSFPQKDWLPAVRKLCENGRFLQEEAAKLLMNQKGISRLLRENGVCLFARALISEAGTVLDADALKRAVQAWQEDHPFSNAELNALPIVLRMALMESLHEHASACLEDQTAVAAAYRAAEHIKNHQPQKAQRWLTRYAENSAFSECLSRFQGTDETREEKIEKEHERQAESALFVSNIIRSLKAISKMPWDVMTEELSLIHQAYQNDPVYVQMDAKSRAYYRARTEQIAQTSRKDEQTVCDTILSLCQSSESIEAHTGYYLFDDGYPLLLAALQAKKSAADRKKKHLLPRIALSALSDDKRTLAVYTVTLTSAQQALQAVKQLQIMHEANPDPNLHFLLLGDFQDSLSATLSSDTEIIQTASAAVEALCETTVHPFFYLQRERMQAPGERFYHCKNHRQGAVDTLLRLMEGLGTEDPFAASTIEPHALKGLYRYAVIVEEGSIVPPGSVLDMVGAMLHPLNRRMEHNGQMRGVSMICPRMKTAPHLVKTTFARWFGRNRKEDSFRLEGIIDPSAFLSGSRKRQDRFEQPELLYRKRSGLAQAREIFWFTGTPQVLKEYLTTLYRTTRKSWQLFPFLLPGGKNNVRKQGWLLLISTLADPLRLLLLFYAALFSHFLVSAAVLLSILRLPLIASLPCRAFIQSQALFRTLYGLITHREQKDLSLELRPSGRFAPLYLSVQMGSAAVLAILSLVVKPTDWLSLALALLWMGFAVFLPYAEREHQPIRKVTEYMRDVLMRLARHTITCFDTIMTETAHELPPERVQIDPNKGISHETTPEDIGFYLCALIASEKMGLMDTQDMAQRISQTVSSLEKLDKWHGLPFARYNLRTLSPIAPVSVSSSACGILAVSLMTCAQGLRMKAQSLPEAYSDLSGKLDALAYGMQLYRLFDENAELFHTEIALPDEKPSGEHHTQLASEALLLSFAAIVLGQVPQSHWQKLSRMENRKQILLSLYGSMSEYMLPSVFLPMVENTLLSQSSRLALKAQKKRRLGGAYGLGASECYAFDPELNYVKQVSGVMQMALHSSVAADVLSPCASMLTLACDSFGAFRNLQRMQMMGLEGPLGLFEAADFNQSRTHGKPFRAVRSHTAKHQAMILCSICNALCDQYIVTLFSSLSCVQAHRLLLEELPSSQRNPVRRPLSLLTPDQMEPQAIMQRQAMPLHFPVDAHLLSGGGTSLLVDAQGGGDLQHEGVQLTEFDSSCRIPSGIRFYLRDSQSGAYWLTADPYLQGNVVFESSQAIFTHSRFDITCEMRLWINPLDGSAVHQLTLHNESGMDRMMEICSYMAPSMTVSADDDARLQIRTERLTKYGVSAVRRTSDKTLYLQHLLTASCPFTMFRIQTDKVSFLGRGRTFHAPRVLDMPISAVADSVGDLIEPCLSLRGQFMLPADGECRFCFITHPAMSDESADAFAQRYVRIENAIQTAETALTRSLVTARFLNLSEEEQLLISRMTGAVCYTEQPFQANTAVLRHKQLSEWHGCRHPMIVVFCTASLKKEVVETLIKAHAFWHMSGFATEMIFEAVHPSAAETIQSLIEEAGQIHLLEEPGGMFILDPEDKERHILLCTAARLLLDASLSISDQLDAIMSGVTARPLYACRSSAEWKPVLPAAEPVWMDNGFGGFTQPEGDYRITLPPGVNTPAPWLHPLMMYSFGTIASENGLMETKKGSITIASGEVIYLRDQMHHLLWSITRQPLGQGMPVRITFAPGETTYESCQHGIYTKMICFTDAEYSFGMRIITLRNTDESPRTLQLFHTGTFHPLAQAQCAAARVYIHLPEYEGTACLCAVDPSRCAAFSMSGGAFQGLWSQIPFSLSSMETLPDSGGNVGVLSFVVHLDPGESCTLSTAIGWAEDLPAFETQLEHIRREGAGKRLKNTRQMWAAKIGMLRFDLPDPALSLMLNRWIPYQAHLSHGRQDSSGLLHVLAAVQAAEASGEKLDDEAIGQCLDILQTISLGAHNLPLSDDGVESVWLAMVLCEALRHFDLPEFQERRKQLLESIERFAWDGGWYLLGWTQDAKKLGSSSCAECRIDARTQSWAVMCGASRDRCAIALENAWRMLYEPDAHLFRRFTPPYMQHALLPGMSDNGGHRTMDACWFISALHQAGQEERAWQLALSLLPCFKSASRQRSARYHGEPYAFACGISVNPHQRGRSTGTWDDDAAGYYWNVMVHQLLGLKKKGNKLRFRPVVPSDWDEVRVTYQHGGSTYHLHALRGCSQPVSEGEELPGGVLLLKDDGKIHEATFPLR